MLLAFKHTRLNPTLDIISQSILGSIIILFSSYQMYGLFDNPHANPFEIVCVAYATVNTPFQFVSKNARLLSTTLCPISHICTHLLSQQMQSHTEYEYDFHFHVAILLERSYIISCLQTRVNFLTGSSDHPSVALSS